MAAGELKLVILYEYKYIIVRTWHTTSLGPRLDLSSPTLLEGLREGVWLLSWEAALYSETKALHMV